MALQLDPTKPGLWTDPDLAGHSASHAIVIGVSDYPHLKGGDGAAAAAHYGLQQLAVSALTAYRFFDWLRSEYRYEDAPLGSVRLLLSPTDEELAHLPEMAGTYGPADYDTCERMLFDWFATLKLLESSVAAKSRSIFFFSGHGLEINQLQQILLPSDYLNPTIPSHNRALSTLNLKHGLLPLAVTDQLFFVDACRNGAKELQGATISGRSIFDVLSTDHNNPNVSSAALYGTASGSQSWQPASPSEGELSLFGDAVLAAMRGGADFDEDEEPPLLWFSDLFQFTNKQVQALLRQRGAQVTQPIRGDLSYVGVVHEHVPLTVVDPSDEVPPTAPGPDEPDPDPEPPSPSAPEPATPERGRPETTPDAGWETFDESAGLHALFGRETLTSVWGDHTRAIDLVTGEPVGIVLHDGDRFEVTNHRIRFSLDSDEPVWLRMDAPNLSYAALLPGYRRARYQLAMTWEGNDLVSFDVDLAPDNEGALAAPADLWATYRSTDAVTAAADIPMDAFELAVGAVQRKVAPEPLGIGDPEGRSTSPLAATVAALILLQSGHKEPFPSYWAGNMARLPQFRELTDGIVIWAESLRRLGSEAPEPPEAALALLAERQIAPVTNDCLAYALALLDVLEATLPDDSPHFAQIGEVADWLRPLAPLNRSGGLFLVLAGGGDQLTPETVLRKRHPD